MTNTAINPAISDAVMSIAVVGPKKSIDRVKKFISINTQNGSFAPSCNNRSAFRKTTGEQQKLSIISKLLSRIKVPGTLYTYEVCDMAMLRSKETAALFGQKLSKGFPSVLVRANLGNVTHTYVGGRKIK